MASLAKYFGLGKQSHRQVWVFSFCRCYRVGVTGLVDEIYLFVLKDTNIKLDTLKAV